MKRERVGSRGQRREQLLEGYGKDSYKSKLKPPDPTRCPDCGAVFRNGRWSWEAATKEAHERVCPACQRIRDRFPAGFVALSGEFFREHRDEILHLVKHCEETEKAAHPVQRLMAIVTTTDVHLARNIAERIHGAYKGSLELHYSKEENLLRATWKR
jgi:hypothetical protein